jgi:hypothetical protein
LLYIYLSPNNYKSITIVIYLLIMKNVYIIGYLLDNEFSIFTLRLSTQQKPSGQNPESDIDYETCDSGLNSERSSMDKSLSSCEDLQNSKVFGHCEMSDDDNNRDDNVNSQSQNTEAASTTMVMGAPNVDCGSPNVSTNQASDENVYEPPVTRQSARKKTREIANDRSSQLYSSSDSGISKSASGVSNVSDTHGSTKHTRSETVPIPNNNNSNFRHVQSDSNMRGTMSKSLSPVRKISSSGAPSRSGQCRPRYTSETGGSSRSTVSGVTNKSSKFTFLKLTNL